MSGRQSEVRAFLRMARKAGLLVELGGNGHYAVVYRGRRIAGIAATPTDHRWRKNAESDIRRATGIELDPRRRQKKGVG